MVSLLHHRPFCFALEQVVTITADRCAGPREGDPRYPRHCVAHVRCFYMRARIRDHEAVLTNPLARPLPDGTFEPVTPGAPDPGRAGDPA